MRPHQNYRRSPVPYTTRLYQHVVHALSLIYHRINVEFADERQLIREIKSRPQETQVLLSSWARRRLFTFPNLVLFIWILALYWGEVAVFNSSIDSCSWRAIENWRHATPHRLIFVADPQLVDPHTYPGRPWPLSTLTVKHTDLYLRRSYSRLQRDLNPDTIIFLGDLFDGGREWATNKSQSPEQRYQKYGDHFWQKEYHRFGRLFFRSWRSGNSLQSGSAGIPRIIATIPGNHDLGFATGIQKPVKDRYNAYFGEGNQINIIGNHTFISVDTVSLSAKEKEPDSPSIWGPPDEFLQNFTLSKDLAVSRYLGTVHNRTLYSKQKHGVAQYSDRSLDSFPNKTQIYSQPYFPNILLTHVPLWRPPNTDCGPLREGSSSAKPAEEGSNNAIPYTQGYQYQCVLSYPLSVYMLGKLDDDIDFAFSGDDHNYCEILHRHFRRRGSGIREITVKSISWAMGVKRPGFLQVSLWNPVTEQGKRVSRYNTPTLRTQLCLLPNQLAIFVRYAILIGITLVVLLMRAWYVWRHPEKYPSRLDTEESILPTFGGKSSLIELESSSSDSKHSQPNGRQRTNTADSTSAFSPEDSSYFLSARNASNTRPRSISPEPNYGGGIAPSAIPNRSPAPVVALPLGGYAMADPVDKKFEDDIRQDSYRWKRRAVRRPGMIEQIVREWGRSMLGLALKVLIWYVWLLRY